MGRTKRHRTRKMRKDRMPYCNRSGMKNLLKFMGSEGFSSKGLRVSNFTETGRGMMALKIFNDGDILISLPKNLLIGVKQAMTVSKWALDLSNLCSHVSSMQLLCVFLLEGKYKVSKEEDFSFTPYIRSLPEDFNHHIFWSDDVLRCLPSFVYKKANLIREKIQEDFLQLKNSIPLNHEMQRHISWYSYRWAWCCINSRCIYSNHEELPNWKFLAPSDSDHYYLAPYLDMFNHSPQAKVIGSYNKNSQSYEIISLQKWRKYEQIFICYGPHSTESLFLEYGFICPGENVNDVVAIPKSVLYNCDNRKLCHSCIKSFETFIVTQRLTEGWHIEKGRLSFNAKIFIALYTVLLSTCNDKCGRPHILTKQFLISSLMMVQNSKLSEQFKSQAEIAQAIICGTMHDIIYDDLLNAKHQIKLNPCSNINSEIEMIQNIFRIFLANTSTRQMGYHVDLFQ